MKKNRPLTKKQSSIIYIIMIINFVIGFCFLYFYTIKNEHTEKYVSLSEYLNYYYLNNHAKFNYINGLWMLFFGVFIICVLMLLEVDSLKIEKRKKD